MSLPLIGITRYPLCSWFRDHRYIALKVYTRDEDNKNEFEIYKQLSKTSQHPGREHVREALDSFTLSRPGGDHQCLVQKPLWESLHDLHYVMPHARLEVDILKSAIKQMLLALDFIHTECKLVHTGTPYLKVNEKRFPLIILEISNRIISCRSLTTPLFSKSSFKTK